MKRFFILPVLALIFIIPACKSGPGPGGKASITGRVYAKGNWNPSCTVYSDSSSGFVPFYAPDEDVYLIYGEDPSYGDKVSTSPDGTFQFKYLRPGKYTVYVYSKNCLVQAGQDAVQVDVEITEKKQEVELLNLRINK